MGREVRRVPPDWEHPTDEDGNWIPVLDRPYDPMATDELGDPYGAIDHRPNWTDEERTHYQWYENVSEGTPMSPPFSTKARLVQFIVENGDPVYGDITKEQAEYFVEHEYAPSFIVVPGQKPMGGMQYLPGDLGEK